MGSCSSIVREYFVLLTSTLTVGLKKVRVMQRTISVDLLSMYILFPHFRPRDALKGIFLLFFSIAMRTFARA